LLTKKIYPENMSKQHPIILAIQRKLQAAENKTNAQAMAAYMKTTMPFYGVKSAERRIIIKQVLAENVIQSQEEYLVVVDALWRQPHREEKYAAIDIARTYKKYHNMLALPLYEKMIREGSWWDFVDDIAINLVGTVLLQNPSIMWPIAEQWISDESLWIRRTAVICQNKFKSNTDAERLFSFCLQRSYEKEFFMRKAIGWALREYAKTEKSRVYAFVEQQKDQLSGLSYREAMKRISKDFSDIVI